MKKDELLNELYKLKRFEVSVGVLDFMSKTAVKFNHVLALVEQLDEPEKVVIPQFVADWIETTKKYSRAISALMNYEGINNESHELALWCFESGNDDNLHNLARAWLDGYEIEKEKLYLVSSDENSSGFWFLSKDNDGEIVIGTNEDYFKAGWKESKLAEKEIKDYDERYWAFAQPVEVSP